MTGRKTLVLKFGGAAVASPAHFHAIASLILRKLVSFERIVAVVSAMGDMTDHLLSLAHEVHPEPPKREVDMLVSTGERISTALLAMALHRQGHHAVSFTGSQSGIVTTEDHTDARIVDVRPYRLLPHLDKGQVVIVAGFQGVSTTKEITTLGRGGSDTTAVALGVALAAERVEFFKDVLGIYSADPRTDPAAQLVSELSYAQAFNLVEKGKHAVLHPRCIRLAEKNNLPLRVLSFKEAEREESGSWIRSPNTQREASLCYEIEERPAN